MFGKILSQKFQGSERNGFEVRKIVGSRLPPSPTHKAAARQNGGTGSLVPMVGKILLIIFQ
jgi:hypothetical protein